MSTCCFNISYFVIQALSMNTQACSFDLYIGININCRLCAHTSAISGIILYVLKEEGKKSVPQWLVLNVQDNSHHDILLVYYNKGFSLHHLCKR